MTQRILIVTLILAWTGAGLLGQRTSVRIGVVFDGPSERGDAAWAVFEREIRDTLQRDYDVEFPSAKRLVGDWGPGAVQTLVDRLLSDSEVDLVLAMGILSSDALARSAPLDKPGFAAFVVDPRLQDLPYEERQYPRPPPEDPMRATFTLNQVRVPTISGHSDKTSTSNTGQKANPYLRPSPKLKRTPVVSNTSFFFTPGVGLLKNRSLKVMCKASHFASSVVRVVSN